MNLLTAIIGIFGVAVGVIIQHYLGKRLEKNKKTTELRFNAYLDFLDIVSEIASSAKHEHHRSVEQLQKLNKSKSRVILIGGNEVVIQINKYFMTYGGLNSEDSAHAFSRIVSAMRSDLSDGALLPNHVILEALFGSNIKKEQVSARENLEG